MKKIKRNIIPFIIIVTIGTLSHFVYKWTNYKTLIGFFFPVNESVWEHLKLIFFPSIIYFAIQYFVIKNKPKSYIPASTISIFHGMFTIISYYYILNGIIGRNIDFLNIIIYFIGVISMLIKREKLFSDKRLELNIFNSLSVIFLSFFTSLFMIFSYNPLNWGIFIPPMNS